MTDNKTALEEVLAGYQEQIEKLTEERDTLQAELDKRDAIVQRILNGGENRQKNSKRDAFIASCKI